MGKRQREIWLGGLYASHEDLVEKFKLTPAREMVIITCALLDTALGDLLARRLCGPSDLIDRFLGLNDHPNAPASSFSARTQLAVLTGLITPRDGKLLDVLRSFRNRMAHRIQVSFLDDDVQADLDRLVHAWKELIVPEGELAEQLDEQRAVARKEAANGEILFLCATDFAQERLGFPSGRVRRIREWYTPAMIAEHRRQLRRGDRSKPKMIPALDRPRQSASDKR